jgi:hypothetical protein
VFDGPGRDPEWFAATAVVDGVGVEGFGEGFGDDCFGIGVTVAEIVRAGSGSTLAGLRLDFAGVDTVIGGRAGTAAALPAAVGTCRFAVTGPLADARAALGELEVVGDSEVDEVLDADDGGAAFELDGGSVVPSIGGGGAATSWDGDPPTAAAATSTPTAPRVAANIQTGLLRRTGGLLYFGGQSAAEDRTIRPVGFKTLRR